MPVMPLALPNGSDQGREPHAGVAALINAVAVPGGDQQKNGLQVWAAPGLIRAATMPVTGGVRGMLEMDGSAFVVVGRSLYQIDSGGSASYIAGIPSDGRVAMARNQRGTGAQLILVSDGLAWVVVGGTRTRITDPDLRSPMDVCVINRSAIFASADGAMYRSEIDNATSVDGLDIARAEAAPDGLLRVIDRGGELVALGTRSTEIWVDTGAEAFGFDRAHVLRMGCLAASSATKGSVITPQTVTDTIAWCATDQEGRSAGIVMLDGYTPRKISSLYVDRLLEQVADPSGITAYGYVSRGQGFLAWRLPETTLVYSTTANVWSERKSRTDRQDATTWRPSYACALGGRTLLGDATLPRAYWLDEDTATDDGDEMVMTVRLPPMHRTPGRTIIDQLRVDVVPGVGLASGASQDIDPHVMMRVSRDGKVWGDGRTRAVGIQGHGDGQLQWPRLGTFRTAHLELSCSAAVVRGFLSASWDGSGAAP